ncbi:4-alpha-glucanotransferase [Pelagibacterium montanilacus]|uniref:4-alpha-glucanotransferase n=1 Tax=Pelagibacterium montanilacus TaxID=2185280 RepID=UPI000F8E0E6B|nr:4-alpha-glucanotransferase [Pelagibacterium montanilacus]
MKPDKETTPSPLQQLAERYGISSRFENAFGTTVAVSSETLGLLLDSMGVHIASEADARDALELAKARATAKLPASVVTVPRDGICRVEIRGGGLPNPLEWRVVLETGEQTSGTFDWSGMAPSESRMVLELTDLPYGYHTLRLPQVEAATHLIVSPGQCWLPQEVKDGQWGIAVQLYLVRSAGNWGIGDFSDLVALIGLAGGRGCGLLGLNPMHQMFLDDPEAASPYSPATRLYLNPIYIDVEAVPEWALSRAAQDLARSEVFQAKRERCRASALVDYAGVTALKLEALRILFTTFTDDAALERKAAFETFRHDKGESLRRASLFQVLRQRFASSGSDHVDWRAWSEDLQTCGSVALEEYAREHRDEVDFQDWLQFVADEQFALAAEAARRKGMAVGLYRDLAVGCAAAGAETWANPDAFLRRSLVGAPPDIFNPAGQNWGLPPFDPVELGREGYRSFAELIRANMLHAGGLRIDHVMGLRRLFCIPEGKSPAEGAYVSFPLDDLLGVLALESQRQHCLVVGEDLGTVPSGFRERLSAANVLSYRVLFFEQDFDVGTFFAPDVYPALAFANTGSHDLPTLLAWWRGDDLVLKQSLGAFETEEETRSQHERRARERKNILAAFASEGLVPDGSNPSLVTPEAFARYAHRFLGLTGAMLLSTQLDDMTGEIDPVNVPGTASEHPNWRRKYRLTLEELANDDQAWSLVEPLARGKPVHA